MYEDDTYFGFSVGGKILYLKDTEKENLEEDMLNWPEFFTKAEESEEDEDIFCEVDDILNMIDDAPIDFYIGDHHISRGDGDKRITAKELGELFAYREDNPETIASLRRLVCKHPLEWNNNLYTNFRESYREQFGVPCSTGTAEYMKNLRKCLSLLPPHLLKSTLRHYHVHFTPHIMNVFLYFQK